MSSRSSTRRSGTIAIEHCRCDPGPLPMVLWQYGLVTISQLEQIYDWLETA
ncbi:DUF2949 domain-containing protein [Romeria aff. gracilis LEGE 07310]|uniref:DUF2949 domain-containing protein n=1 Tax=Vasconcelosia minhoensis LEGE 07310 TaxID=915328 RepID=A0A8J7AKS6_9CYAN|nr:DUF2949 domain-containing protein [Romeria aff. gracilis LEGE 07310]